MCRSNIAPAAAEPLAALLTDMIAVLAEQLGVDPAAVRVGPVDFGDHDETGERWPTT